MLWLIPLPPSIPTLISLVLFLMPSLMPVEPYWDHHFVEWKAFLSNIFKFANPGNTVGTIRPCQVVLIHVIVPRIVSVYFRYLVRNIHRERLYSHRYMYAVWMFSWNILAVRVTLQKSESIAIIELVSIETFIW